MKNKIIHSEVIVIGGGLAGLSAAIYLGRAKRQALVVDFGTSMAQWEPDVQNYLGFPRGVSGEDLLARGRSQALTHEIRFQRDHVLSGRASKGRFTLRGERGGYTCERLLLATGIFHIPPDIPGVKPCLGHSMFFCKDCDGYRVQGKPIGVYGWTNATVEYALGMLPYSACVAIMTDGHPAGWDRRHREWLREYRIPVYGKTIVNVHRRRQRLLGLILEDATEVAAEALFITRGDIYFNKLAKCLGAQLDATGEIQVDQDMRTSVRGLYAAGCVTPANCQMIIAAGQGATAAQAINRDLFMDSLTRHTLVGFRERQLRKHPGRPKTTRKRARVSPRSKGVRLPKSVELLRR